jgi:hypothetical protein
MSDKCPLQQGGLYWDNEAFSRIPDICTRLCGEIFEETLNGSQVSKIDMFDPDCGHNVEHGGMSLQRGNGSDRYIGILSMCVKTGGDVFSDTYTFQCPND